MNYSRSNPITPNKPSQLTLRAWVGMALTMSAHMVVAQGTGNASGTAAPGTSGIPVITPAQTTAITAMDQSLRTKATAAATARRALISATYSASGSEADLKAKLALLQDAELALAKARADEFIKLQAGPDMLNTDQVAMLTARVERLDRTGGPSAGSQERPIVAQFDADKNGRLNTAERARAVDFINSNGGGLGFRGGPGGRGNRPSASPGVKLTSADVKNYSNEPLYDAAVLRTFFIELENPNWEAEMVAFNNTDVEIPAKVTVDGKAYSDVGIHFRGNSSFGVGNGYKRSLGLTFDFVNKNQSILGYRTLNFLNANDDPTFLHTVLSLHIARQYMPAPKANLVRVVINGENWGIYANSQQFNKEFLKENFKTEKGTRWKVPQGGGDGIGGFRYVDQDANSYRNVFHIKSKDEPAAWTALIELARTLQQTPVEKLEAALAPKLDIDGYLRFLALDNAMANGDGFYTRGADYSLYLDPDGRFHLLFYDANEMFSSGGARGGGGGPGGPGAAVGGTSLSPLAAQNDTGKPIISRILAVPSLRAKYLGYVREIAEKSFDWKTLGPVVKQYRDLIKDDVSRDTRKLFTTDQFLAGTADELSPGNLRNFFDQRRAFLLNWSESNTARTAP